MPPAYEYSCPSCGHSLEVLKRMEDAGTVEFCPGDDFTCRQPMERVYDSAPAAKVAGGTPKFHHRKARAGS